MDFHYTVYLTDGTSTKHTWDIDTDDPGYDKIKALVGPLIGDGEPFEHVSVLHNGERADMFVAEMGALTTPKRGPLPTNDAATKVYRAATMRHAPRTHPDSLPCIYGPAVLFDEQVWF